MQNLWLRVRLEKSCNTIGQNTLRIKSSDEKLKNFYFWSYEFFFDVMIRNNLLRMFPYEFHDDPPKNHPAETVLKSSKPKGPGFETTLRPVIKCEELISQLSVIPCKKGITRCG